MLVISKSGVIDIEIFKDESYNNKEFYEMIAYDRHQQEMGFINFEITQNEIWIWLIQTKDKFQHMGVGQALLDMMEYMAVLNKCKHIEGKFYPENFYARPFYIKNNYKIDDDDYNQYVSKYIFDSDGIVILHKMEKNLLTPFEIKDISQKPALKEQHAEK